MESDAAAACLDALDGAFLRALAEPARVAILRTLLVMGRADVGTIAQALPWDRSVTTRHLQILRDARLVRSTAEGRHTFYELDGEGAVAQLEQLTAFLRALQATCCPPPPHKTARAAQKKTVAPPARRR